MDAITKQLFMQGLRQGMGLSKSAEMANISPREASDSLKADPEAYKEALLSIRLGVTTFSAMVKSLGDKKKYNQWAAKVEELRGFVTKLNLWESYCTAKDVDDDVFLAVLMEYRVVSEAATVIGFTKREYIAYLMERSFLITAFKEYGIFLESATGILVYQ